MPRRRWLAMLCALALATIMAAPQLSFAAEGSESAPAQSADAGGQSGSLAAGEIAVPTESGDPTSVDDAAATTEPATPVDAAEVSAPISGKVKHVSNGTYYIKSASSSRVMLADPRSSTSKGTQMRTAKAAKSAAQKFYLRNEGHGLVSLQVVASGLFLGEKNGRVVQLADSENARMRWKVMSDHGIKFVNASSGSVLSLAGGRVKAGAAAVAAVDAGRSSQRWKLSSANLMSDGYYRMKSASGAYLEIASGSCAYGANVQTWARNSTGSQVFHIYAKSGAYCCIENAKSFLLVGVKGSSKANRANVVQVENKAQASALWKPTLDRSGKIVFKNKKSGKVLEASSSGKAGSNVRQNRAGKSRGQRWTLKQVEPYSLSGNGDLDRRIANVLRTRTDLRSAYYWVVSHPYREGQRYYSNPHVLPDSRTISLANDFLLHGSGNCYRFACTFSWLARGLGYKTNVISGWVAAAGGGQAPHGWVEVVVDGRTYVCDPDLQHEMPGYNWYMTTYATSPTAYHSW